MFQASCVLADCTQLALARNMPSHFFRQAFVTKYGWQDGEPGSVDKFPGYQFGKPGLEVRAYFQGMWNLIV